MAHLPATEAELTQQASEFIRSIDETRARWEYCLAASHYRYRTKRGDVILQPNSRSMPVAAKILGRRKFWVERALRELRQYGWEGAQEREADTRRRYGLELTSLPKLFEVGPLKAWEAGHVYFSRVADHPHVVKIGFSRRVHERLDDIESANKTRLVVRPGQLRVGTLLNEHWWHRNWQATSISGEWFFDPFTTERTLPSFLQQQAEAA